MGFHVQSILKNHSHGFTGIVFTTGTITFLNNAAVVFNIIINRYSIAFMKESLHHYLVPTFAKVWGQFVNTKDKARAKESILKWNLVEHKRNIQILSRNHENFVEQLKHKSGITLFRMLYINILAVLRRSDLDQLKRKNNKLRMLSLKVLKNRDSYQVLVINLSFQVLDTKPLKCGLH